MPRAGAPSPAAALSRPGREPDATRTGRAAHGGAGTPPTAGVRSPGLGSSPREPSPVDPANRTTRPGPARAQLGPCNVDPANRTTRPGPARAHLGPGNAAAGPRFAWAIR